MNEESMNQELNEHYQQTQRIIDRIEIHQNQLKKRRCAIFVMVQNEPIFLPIWLKYYSSYFDGEDIFVFDHCSTDTSVQDSAQKFSFKAIRLEYPYSFDHQWFRFVAQNTIRKLLQYYEYVIFTDIDEIIYIQNKPFTDLGHYLHKIDKDCVQCTGYDLIHVDAKEKHYRPDKPVLLQRKYWYRTTLYDKTLITCKPINWDIGFHCTSDRSSHREPDLLLIHLHKLDYETCRHNTLKRSKLPWTDTDMANNWGWQNRITDSEKFRDFFYRWPDWIKIEKIPRKIRKSKLF